MCNSANTTCTPGSANCCWRPVPHALVFVERVDTPIVRVASTATSSTGSFSVAVSGEPTSATYFVYVRSQHTTDTGFYSGARVNAKISGSVVSFESSHIFSSGSTLPFGTLKVNSGGDTTSTTGDAFTAYVAADAAFGFLDLEGGETRHHVTGGWTIAANAGSSYADCDGNTINIQSTYARELELVHLLGFGYMGAVMGCSGNNPAYPKYHDGGYDRYTAEGNALRVGIPSLLVTLSRFNPDTASTTDIFASTYDCRSNGWDNANFASDERNNWHGLWEFVDTDDGNDSGDGTDLIDLTVKDVMDGLVALEANSGSAGDNNTSDEQILTEVPYSVCFDADDCDPYDACVGYVCYTGDPHGENIWDLIYNLCADQGDCPGFGGLAYLSTVMSSPCLGAFDDDYEFTGGFHSD